MEEGILSVLAGVQEELEEMTIRFQKLKKLTVELYKENETLNKENEELKKIVFENKKDKGQGYSNLMYLYQEGYHVCHTSFGEKRKGDCLFCQKLIDRQIEEK